MIGLKNCIFCQSPLSGRYEHGKLRGQKRKTNEHIFPQWLQQYLSLEKQPLKIQILESDKSRELVYDSFLTPICRECNQGWLSDLESKAKPVLQPLIDGTQQDNISLENRRILSLWLLKTAIVLNAASLRRQEEPLVPAEHYHFLYEQRCIPEGVVISIAPCYGETDLTFIQGKAWSSPPGEILPPEEILTAYFEKSYTIAICLGHLAWRVLYWTKWPNEYGLPPGYDEWLAGIIRTVHPMNLTEIPWPPADSIDSLQLLFESLTIKSNKHVKR